MVSGTQLPLGFWFAVGSQLVLSGRAHCNPLRRRSLLLQSCEQRDRRSLGTELWGTPTVKVWRKQEKPLKEVINRRENAENRWRDEIDVKERRNTEE